MGGVQSVLQPQTGPPMPVAALPVQRYPVRDGASGLHYSGRIYDNQRQQMSSDICNGASVSVEQINDVMPNSISTTTLPDDTAIKQQAIQSYVKGLGNKIPGHLSNFDEQAVADAQLYESIKGEYCFYESRYIAALKQFVALIADPRGADQSVVSGILTTTVNLNKRLNSLIEIMNYIGNERAKEVNRRSPTINETNEKLKKQLDTLNAQQKFLESSDVRIRTQEEMMRFSAEKSRAMNIQIMFFVALNVVAIGTILTVYKNIRPSV